ncbi:hypothetical protein F5884DRAFT_835327 [Xylogone sp. PMI_703]|nr:hypothetical protein F5884DRAFT_835327 [Xylogone sp. PMI_703]
MASFGRTFSSGTAIASSIASVAVRAAAAPGSHGTNPKPKSSASDKNLRTLRNQQAVMGYATVVCTIIGIFTLYHWVKCFLRRRQVSGTTGPVTKIVRYSRSISLRKVPFGFESIGHFVVFVVFIALQIALIFWNINVDNTIPLGSRVEDYGKRVGRICASNICLLVFLAMKNTPLSFMTSYSYKYLNILHRLAGWTTMAMIVLHVILYLIAYSYRDKMDSFRSRNIIYGEVAAACAFVMCLFAAMRRRFYELFYITHVSFFIVLVVAIRLHRPKLSMWLVWFCLFMGVVWSTDRILRALKLIFYAPGNYATLTPLPHGGVKITLKRKAHICRSGTSHLYLWIPAIRPFETHPFTVASAEPLELVIKAYDGFTKSLVKHANENPGVVLRASIQGPYNSLSHIGDFSHLILVAGGGGASFTFGAAIQALRVAESKGKSIRIDFIWALRHEEQLTWFSRDLEVLKNSPSVSIILHNTSCASSSSSSTNATVTEKSSPALSRSGSDLEKNMAAAEVIPADLVLRQGRPDIAALVREYARRGGEALIGRVLIAACGPVSMLDVVRECGRKAIRESEVPVEVHLETFGW